MDLIENRLVGGIASPESVETDALPGEIDFCADQAMGPIGVYWEDVSQETDLAFGVGATQQDDASFGECLEVEFPVLGERPARGRSLDPDGSTTATGGDEFRRSRLQGASRGMGEAGPDLGLPAAVEVFDGGLEASLPRRREDRDQVQGQTEADDTAERIGMLVGSLEDGIVVELDIAGQPVPPPVGTRASTTVLAVILALGQEAGRPP